MRALKVADNRNFRAAPLLELVASNKCSISGKQVINYHDNSCMTLISA